MGEIHAVVILENAGDREYFRRGDRAEADIRRATVDGIVDTGAVTLVLPQNLVERLGLETQGTALVTNADERREERPLAGPVGVQIGNRSMTMECVVGPPLSEVLIGQVVLERLDLIADCTMRTLTPRYEDYPLLKLKALGDKSPIRSMTSLMRRVPVQSVGVRHYPLRQRGGMLTRGQGVPVPQPDSTTPSRRRGWTAGDGTATGSGAKRGPR